MRRAVVVLVLLLLPGAAIILGAIMLGLYLPLSDSIKTSDPYLERYRSWLAWRILVRFGIGATKEIARAMLGILDRENKGRQPPPLVGDVALGGGPSIGPGQVYRSTAIALGFVPPDTTADQYAALAGEEHMLVDWSVQVFRSKLRDAGGDIAKAIELYNGSGPAAENYRSGVVAWLAETFGDQPLGAPPEEAA